MVCQMTADGVSVMSLVWCYEFGSLESQLEMRLGLNLIFNLELSSLHSLSKIGADLSSLHSLSKLTLISLFYLITFSEKFVNFVTHKISYSSRQ